MEERVQSDSSVLLQLLSNLIRDVENEHGLAVIWKIQLVHERLCELVWSGQGLV